MAFKANVLRVFIASPSDLQSERLIVVNAIHEWNELHAEERRTILLPVRWENHSHPQTGIRPQEAINEQLLKDSDLLIGILWSKLGTKTEVAESGTVEEIRLFASAQKPAMLYFSDKPISVNKINTAELDRLSEFKSATYKNALVGNFESEGEFAKKISTDLLRQVREMLKTHPSQTEEPASRKVEPFEEYLFDLGELPDGFEAKVTGKQTGYNSAGRFYEVHVTNTGKVSFSIESISLCLYDLARSCDLPFQEVFNSVAESPLIPPGHGNSYRVQLIDSKQNSKLASRTQVKPHYRESVEGPVRDIDPLGIIALVLFAGLEEKLGLICDFGWDKGQLSISRGDHSVWSEHNWAYSLDLSRLSDSDRRWFLLDVGISPPSTSKRISNLLVKMLPLIFEIDNVAVTYDAYDDHEEEVRSEPGLLVTRKFIEYLVDPDVNLLPTWVAEGSFPVSYAEDMVHFLNMTILNQSTGSTSVLLNPM